jgi:hypothetical protein
VTDELDRQLYIKTLSGFRPVNEAAEKFAHKISMGTTVELKGSRPRNLQHHKKFFKMLDIVFENQTHYKSVEELLGICKLAIGHCDVVQTPRGPQRLPKSISFASMNQSQFEDFYDRSVQWVTTDVIAGLARKDLDAEVEQALLRF